MQPLSIHSDFTSIQAAYYALRLPAAPARPPRLKEGATSAAAEAHVQLLLTYESNVEQYKVKCANIHQQREVILGLFTGKLKTLVSPAFPDHVFNRVYKDATHYSDGSLESIRECFVQLTDLIQYAQQSQVHHD